MRQGQPTYRVLATTEDGLVPVEWDDGDWTVRVEVDGVPPVVASMTIRPRSPRRRPAAGLRTRFLRGIALHGALAAVRPIVESAEPYAAWPDRPMIMDLMRQGTRRTGRHRLMVHAIVAASYVDACAAGANPIQAVADSLGWSAGAVRMAVSRARSDMGLLGPAPEARTAGGTLTDTARQVLDEVFALLEASRRDRDADDEYIDQQLRRNVAVPLGLEVA